jgi:hypothetical protein
MDFKDHIFQIVDFLLFFFLGIKSIVFRPSRIFLSKNKLETTQFPAKKYGSNVDFTIVHISVGKSYKKTQL